MSYECPDRVRWPTWALYALYPAVDISNSTYSWTKLQYQLAPSSTVYGPWPFGCWPNVVCLTRPPISPLYSMITKSSTEALCSACCLSVRAFDAWLEMKFPYGCKYTSTTSSTITCQREWMYWRPVPGVTHRTATFVFLQVLLRRSSAVNGKAAANAIDAEVQVITANESFILNSVDADLTSEQQNRSDCHCFETAAFSTTPLLICNHGT